MRLASAVVVAQRGSGSRRWPGQEGVLQYLNSVAAHQQPFFMIVSLINPHDVLMYPSKYRRAGYNDSWLEGGIGLPATVDEDLSTKPSAAAISAYVEPDRQA